jgi:tetratricopeptide (TPR) repeat protein
MLGRWDELDEICERLVRQGSEDVTFAEVFTLYAFLAAARGNLDALNALVPPAGSVESADAQVRNMIRLGQATVARANGRAAEAFEILREVVPVFDPQTRRMGYITAGEAASELDDVAALEELTALVDQLTPAEATPLMRGQAARFAGLVAAKRGDLPAAEELLDAAIALMRELGYPYELGKALLDRGESLRDGDRIEESIPFLDEARAIFTDLGARPLLERAEGALAGRPASAA